jgi:hypothetical protein
MGLPVGWAFREAFEILYLGEDQEPANVEFVGGRDPGKSRVEASLWWGR